MVQFKSLASSAWSGTQKAAGSTVGMIALTFLTLFGVWGFGDYKPPKFFTWLTAEAPFVKYFMQWLMMFVLAYQGLGDKNLLVSFIASTLFFGIFEIVKLIERMFWKDEPAQE